MNTDMTENEYQEAVDELKRYVEEHRENEITNEKSELYRETLTLCKDRVIWGLYLREDTVADFSVASVAFSTIFGKELMFFGYNLGPIVEMCRNINYGLSVHRYDRDGLLIDTKDFTPTEVDRICKESEHRTSKKSWKLFVDNWNKQFPIFIDRKYYILCTEIKDNTAIVNNAFFYKTEKESDAVNKEDLTLIIQNDFQPSEDCFLSLAILNKMNIRFRFIVLVGFSVKQDWLKEIMITPEEYSKYWPNK